MLKLGWVVLLIKVVSAAEPLLFTYGPSYGPDGPWHALEVRVGGQNVNLYPGALQTTRLLGTAGCEEACLGSTYNRSASNSTADPFVDLPDDRSDSADLAGASPKSLMNQTGKSILMSDTLELTDSSGRSYTIENTALVLINGSRSGTPDNTSYENQVGFFGIGQDRNPWTWSGATTNITPSWLAGASIIPSNSYGVHVGSVPQGQLGSLVLGGYDRSRVVSPIGDWGFRNHLDARVTLAHLGLGVEIGQSPLDLVGDQNFIAETRPSGLLMGIDPTAPYIYLSIGICEAIASFLPVFWLNDLGLYAWNTSSPRYNEIMGSAAYMAFTFNHSDPQDITIKVPFQLLNLTLEAPIVDQPLTYFPCKSSPDIEGTTQFLGRAFLQAAYFSIPWDRDDGARFSLAQAPGPDVGEPNVIPLGRSDKLVPDENMTFAQSWQRRWPSTGDALTLSEPEAQDDNERMSGGAIAGIVIGIAVLLIGFAWAIRVFVLRFQSKSQGSSGKEDTSQDDHIDKAELHEGVQPPVVTHEVSAKSSYRSGSEARPVEVANTVRVLEMGYSTRPAAMGHSSRMAEME